MILNKGFKLRNSTAGTGDIYVFKYIRMADILSDRPNGI